MQSALYSNHIITEEAGSFDNRQLQSETAALRKNKAVEEDKGKRYDTTEGESRIKSPLISRRPVLADCDLMRS